MSTRNLEALFRSHRIPYVDVTVAMKQVVPEGLTSEDGPEPFHFVAYGPSCNWLVYVGKRTTETVALMRRWEGLFGSPFVAVFARFRTHPEFESIDGVPMKLDFYEIALKTTRRPEVASVSVPSPIGSQLDLFA